MPVLILWMAISVAAALSVALFYASGLSLGWASMAGVLAALAVRRWA